MSRRVVKIKPGQRLEVDAKHGQVHVNWVGLLNPTWPLRLSDEQSADLIDKLTIAREVAAEQHAVNVAALGAVARALTWLARNKWPRG